MEVRAWSGAGWWEVLPPGAGVVEVEAAGAVQGVLGFTDGQATWQDGVLVAVAAGEVDGEPPQAGRAGIPQPAQGQHLAVGQLAVDVGEAAPEPHVDSGEPGPAFPLALAEPLAERGLGGLGDRRGRHRPILPEVACWCLVVSRGRAAG